MTAYKGGPEMVLLGREMGGDLGKDLGRNAIDVNEGVPPLPDSHQCGQSIPVELTSLAEGEAIERVSVLPFPTMIDNRLATYGGECTVCFSFSFRAKTSWESDKLFPG